MQKKQQLPQKDVFMRRFFKLKLLALGIVLTNSQLSFAGNETANFEASAKIENFCSIQASDVNFGVVALPLTAQSANAQMKVLCSNNTPYKVDLTYGKYASSDDANYTIRSDTKDNWTYVNRFFISVDGKEIGYINCGKKGLLLEGQIGIYVNQTKDAHILENLLGYQNMLSVHTIPDTNKRCVQNELNQTVVDGFKGNYYNGNVQSFSGYTSEYGLMIGAVRNDGLAYKFSLPNDSTKAWVKGKNSYTSNGNGNLQSIAMNAQIVPDKSSSNYIAQDFYLDTVTAEISY